MGSQRTASKILPLYLLWPMNHIHLDQVVIITHCNYFNLWIPSADFLIQQKY